MGKVKLIRILMFFLALVLLAKASDFDELAKLTNLKEGEYLAVLFMKRGDCPKCYDLPLSILNKLEAKSRYFKIVGAIECYREIELKAFKKEFNWKHYLYMDDGKLRERFGESKYTIFILFNSKGKKILQVRQSYAKEDIEVLKSFYDGL